MSVTDLISVHVSPRGRFAEVILTDFEDPDMQARSGYLDEEGRAAMAARLRVIATELEAVQPVPLDLSRDGEVAA